MNKLTPMEAWQRIAATSTRRKAKGTATVPECTAVGDYYVFESGVVLSAYEELPPILGEGESGGASIPPAMAQFLEMLSQEIANAESKDTTNTPTKAPKKAKTSRKTIQPLIECKWNQTAPFNDKIIIGGKKCVTGCNATALAQLIYYWGCQPHKGKYYHRGCTAVKGYSTKTNDWKVEGLPPIKVFDYANLVPKNPKTKVEKNAVATLMEYCGKAMRSDYKPNATSAFASEMADVLEQMFRLKANWKYPQNQSIAWLEDTIYLSLYNGYPVVLGGKNKGSHCFLCDGYDADTGKFHFNWGWGGSYDGWYYITALTPSSSDYSSLHALIVGIHPEYILGDVNGDGDVSVQDLSESVKVVMSGEYNEKADVNSDGKVDVNDVQTIANHITGKEQL